MGKSDWCGGYKMSPHALERQREMGISDVELAECLRNPDQVYSQENYDRDAKVHQKGRISAVVKPKVKVCLTVLWRTTDEYKRKD